MSGKGKEVIIKTVLVCLPQKGGSCEKTEEKRKREKRDRQKTGILPYGGSGAEGGSAFYGGGVASSFRPLRTISCAKWQNNGIAVLLSEQWAGIVVRPVRGELSRPGSDMPNIPMSPKRKSVGYHPSCFPGLIQCH